MREIILTSSVLIAVIILLRYVLRGKITPRLQYALWMLVAVRLLLPGTLFTVPISVMGAADGLSTVLEQSFQETSPSVLDAPASPSAAVSDAAAGRPGPSPSLPERGEPARPAADWLDLAWKGGMLVTGCALVLSNLVFYRNLRSRRRLLSLPPEYETGNLPVYLVEGLSSPCLFGLFCPAIYLNTQALDPAHLTYVLTHERTHFRHGDHIWSLLRGICLTVHWYNPLVWLAASMSRQDCELACDDGVIWLLGERNRLDYGTTLVQMIAQGRPSLLRASTSMTAGKRNMKERIALIIRRPRMLKATASLAALAVCATVAVTFGSTAAKADGGDLPETFQDISLPETFQDISLPGSPRSLTRLEEPSYLHFSGLFSVTVPEEWAGALLYEENEDGVFFYDAAYGTASEESLLLSIFPQASAWASAYDRDAVFLDKFNTSGSPYVYLLSCDRTDNGDVLALRDAVAESFQMYAGASAFSRLVHETYKEDMSLSVAYLPYLSWENYRDTYGGDELDALLTDLTAFARTGEADWGQYHDLMSSPADAAIAGADTYLDFVWELYQKNPSQFATVLQSEYLTSAEREHMLSWFRSAVAVKQDWPEILDFSDDVIYELLGIDDVKSVG